MDEQGSLNHTKWECKYPVVFIPKCRRKTLYQELRRYLGKYSVGWQSSRRVRLKQGICARIMGT